MLLIDTSFSDFHHFLLSRISDDFFVSFNSESILTNLFQNFYNLLVTKFLDSYFSDFSIHAYYTRFIIINDFKIPLSVLRVKDLDGHTHAILPAFFIPYKWYCVDDYLDIINDSHSSLTLNSFHYELKVIMKAVFRKWILSHTSPAFSVFDYSVVHFSFSNFNIQFLQSASHISNSLFFLASPT